jgi:hypothetical protein
MPIYRREVGYVFQRRDTWRLPPAASEFDYLDMYLGLRQEHPTSRSSSPGDRAAEDIIDADDGSACRA